MKAAFIFSLTILFSFSIGAQEKSPQQELDKFVQFIQEQISKQNETISKNTQSIYKRLLRMSEAHPENKKMESIILKRNEKKIENLKSNIQAQRQKVAFWDRLLFEVERSSLAPGENLKSFLKNKLFDLAMVEAASTHTSARLWKTFIHAQRSLQHDCRSTQKSSICLSLFLAKYQGTQPSAKATKTLKPRLTKKSQKVEDLIKSFKKTGIKTSQL